MDENVRTKSDLADALGISNSYLGLLCKNRWFPGRKRGGVYDVIECLKAFAKNTNGERAKEARQKLIELGEWEAPEPVAEINGGRLELSSAAELRDAIESGDPLSIARAAVRVAGERLYVALTRPHGEGWISAANRLRQTIGELRKCEGDYLDLAERKGELIEREDAAACAGLLLNRAVQCLDAVKADIVTQFEIWIHDDELMSRPTEERGREIARWFDEQARAARDACADDFERMIDEAG